MKIPSLSPLSFQVHLFNHVQDDVDSERLKYLWEAYKLKTFTPNKTKFKTTKIHTNHHIHTNHPSTQIAQKIPVLPSSKQEV